MVVMKAMGIYGSMSCDSDERLHTSRGITSAGSERKIGRAYNKWGREAWINSQGKGFNINGNKYYVQAT